MVIRITEKNVLTLKNYNREGLSKKTDCFVSISKTVLTPSAFLEE